MHFVTIDWLKFLPGLVLLLTPVAVLEGRRVHFRDIDRDWDRHWPQILSLWLHYFDFARAALGTWLLIDSLNPIPNAAGIARYAPLVLQGSIRLVAVFVQTVWCREPDSANAPFAFVTGMLVAGVSPLAATIALALAITMAAGSRTPVAFFPVLSVAFLGVGFWFGGKSLVTKISPGGFAPLIPWLWPLLFHRTLVVPYRAKGGGRSNPPTGETDLR
jgi:hypothetical protein